MKKFAMFFFGITSISTSIFASAVNVDVDASNEIGKIKRLNSANFGSTISSENACDNEKSEIIDLGVPLIRLHDISLQNPGLNIVDTNLVFPLMHADENDPRNYDFAATDDYIKECNAIGANVVYRLGVSIDHSKRKYRTTPPEPEKWARICIKIIEHLNEGWANGHHFGIKYWEIWNEPECINRNGAHTMWSGTRDEYNEFYAKTSKIIKARFPDIKIGGPSHTSFTPRLTLPFLKKVKETNAPLDFYSWHLYAHDIDRFASDPVRARKFLDENGFPNAELHLNEWHPLPKTMWAGIRLYKNNPDFARNSAWMKSLEVGVRISATLTAWQDTPLDHAMVYTLGGKGRWGMFAANGAPEKVFYPFKAFCEIAKFPVRLSAKANSPKVYPLAAKNDNGQHAILVSVVRSEANMLVINVKNADVSKAQVLICSDVKNLEPSDGVKLYKDRIAVPINSDSATVLVKF